MSKTESLPESEGRTDAILETTDLTKRFGALVANDGITFSVERGEIRGLIGPNGSGKSTFFNTITGFYAPDGGTVQFDGGDVTGWKPHRLAQNGLARTFQITTPFEELTVRDNLLAVPTEESSVERRDRASEILTFLDIDHLADEKAKEMSGGQQKLLELARVLMLEPQCILLDEPMAGVNPALENRIIEHIREMNRDGTSFVIVEHDIDMVRQVADTISVFNQGRQIAQGTFDEIKDDTGVREAYLGGVGEESVGLRDRSRDDASRSTESRSIVAENVVTGYGNHEVVHNVSVESRDGVTCILGPNGSGKSTVLKSLNGQVPVWSGSVRYGDIDLTEFGPLETMQEGIVTLPQEGGVLGTLSVKDNLTLGATNVLNDEERVQQNLERVLEEFPDLRDKLRTNAGDLSGGQQMMVSFGRAMMTDADVFLLDEPTAGLAPSLVEDVLDLIDLLVEDGAQVILIEQNVKAALELSDYAYILAQGELQFEGTPDELSDEDELMEIYLGL